MTIKSEVTQVLQSAGFELSRWFSNSPESTASVSTVKPITLSDSELTKALGIDWVAKENIFKFELNLDHSFGDIEAVSPLWLIKPYTYKRKNPIA